jgi:spore germination protein YaaH
MFAAIIMIGRAPDTAGAAEATTTSIEQARAKTSAWIVTWDRPLVLASLRKNAKQLGQISPFWFYLASDGATTKARSGARDPEVLRIARANDIKVIPTVSNDFDSRRMSIMLRTPASRAKHIAQLTSIVNRPSYTGLDVDYENIAAADRARFTSFVRALNVSLGKIDRTLTITIPARTATDSGAPAYDYASLGAIADEVRIMSYDYHWSCGRSGPVAPITWVEQTVKYARSKIPARKLVLGMPLYGYDWPRTGCAQSRKWQTTMSIVRRNDAQVRWYAAGKSPFVRYQRRIIWFENARSSHAKASLVSKYKLKGVVMWRLGGEDPATWTKLVDALGRA